MRKILVIVACTLLCAGISWAQAPLQVGEINPISIDSERLDRAGARKTADGWTVEISHPGATFVVLHFAEFDLPADEKVTISDPDGHQSYVLSGQGKMQAGEFWSQHIKGSEVVLKFSTRRSLANGFSIDKYSAGTFDLGGPEAICGANDKENAVCYQNSHPTEYSRSQSVARMLTTKSNGSFLCTGWLASDSNHFVTNEHCVTSATEALNTDYEFEAEAANCGDNNCQLCHPGVVISGATFIQDSAALDYALLQITSVNPASTYGYLEIDDRAAVVGEQIYIPQHPNGRARELGIESTDPGNPSGVCEVDEFTNGCSSSSYQDVGYQCDTEGGSSGSPVLATSSHKVIALHHCANCPNRGVPITLVCDEICDIIQPACSVDADCDDGDACTNDVCLAGSCSNDPIADCCGNGTCELGEDCNTCAADCVSGTSSGAACGNGVCEAGDGEDCLSCPSDCNGKQNGKPSNRFCCGDGDGENPVSCGDSRCSTGGFSCTTTPGSGGSFCCGDTLCDSGEDCGNCDLDCDLGFEVCDNGSDDDCDGDIDCNDSDCSSDAACQGGSGQQGDPCVSDSDCASGKCRGPSGNKTCK